MRPAELYENPRSTFVANFLGQSNLIEGDVQAGERPTSSRSTCTASTSRSPTARAHTDGDRGWVGIRPEKVLIGDAGRGARRAGQHHPRWRGQRRQLRRRQHAVPRADAVGPGAPGVRSRTPAGPGSSGTATRSSCPGARSTPSSSTARRTPSAGAERRTPDDQHGGVAPADAVTATPAPETQRPRGLDRLPAAAARRGVAAALLRGPVLLAGRDQPLRPDRVGLPRLRDDLARQQLRRRVAGVLAARWCARSSTARSPRPSAWSSATCWPTRSPSRPGGGRT